jgi:hypothetical protein
MRAADVLTQRLGTPVTSDGVTELARRGLIPAAGHYKGFAVYDGRALEAFTDASAATQANRAGRLRIAGEAAEYLRIRRADLDHLIRAGLLTPAGWAHGPFDRRGTRSVPLYRTADLDDLEDIVTASGIGWDAVRATPKRRGRLEQNLIDLGVRDPGLLRQGAGVDQMAQQVLAQAHRSGLASPQPHAQAASEPTAGDPAAEAEAAVTESMVNTPHAGPALQPPWRAGEGKRLSAVAERGASLDTPEIGDEEPGLEL